MYSRIIACLPSGLLPYAYYHSWFSMRLWFSLSFPLLWTAVEAPLALAVAAYGIDVELAVVYKRPSTTNTSVLLMSS
jgi:hypothetical protein